MKNILLSLMLMSCFVGCSYSTSKSIYVNSKKIVVELYMQKLTALQPKPIISWKNLLTLADNVFSPPMQMHAMH